MSQSYIEYTSGLSGTTFDVPFKYISINDVKALGFDGSSYTALTISERNASEDTITLAAAPSAYTSVRLYRSTSTTQLVDFQNGSRLSEADLDTAYQQGLFAAQEIAEDASTSQFSAVAAAAIQSGTSLSNFSSKEIASDGTDGLIDGVNAVYDISALNPQTSVSEAYRVSIDGVMQSPVSAYSITITPAEITFSEAPPVGAKIVIVSAASAASAVSVDNVTIGLTSGNQAEIKDGGVDNDKLAGGITQDKLAGSIPQSKLSLDLINDGAFTTGVSATSLASSESIKAFVQGMRPKFVALTGGTTDLTKTNPSDGSTAVYNIADFTSGDSDFATTKITGLIVEGLVACKTNTNLIEASLPDGSSTVICRTVDIGQNGVSDSATSFIPINSDTTSFTLRYTVSNTTFSTHCQSIIKGAIIVPNL